MLNYRMQGEYTIVDKFNRKSEIRKMVREEYFNAGRSIKYLAAKYNKSQRTIYRWLQKGRQKDSPVYHKSTKKSGRPKIYPPEITARIISLKNELPQRSAVLVHKILKKEYPDKCPSLSFVRHILRENGLTRKNGNRKYGYIHFQRKKPNDMWQIDIAGVQTIAHLGQLYLIALLDDCSRFIVAATYFRDQTSENVIKVIRDAVIGYGRPNEILSDNGTQFRNILGDLGTKYTKLLRTLGIKPTFARPYHPQTKGKLERWFKTVVQMFLVEARFSLEQKPETTLPEFNQMLRDWVKWYNYVKSHRSLPNRCAPAKIFFETEDRIFRPLQANVNWNRWLHEISTRKVNKYNEIHYKSQRFSIPPGHSGLKIEVIEYEDKIEIYYKENMIITHSYNPLIKPENTVKTTRKIRHNGTISYKGKYYSIDYKLANKTVKVQETDDGRKLLVYLHGIRIKTLNL